MNVSFEGGTTAVDHRPTGHVLERVGAGQCSRKRALSSGWPEPESAQSYVDVMLPADGCGRHRDKCP